MAKVVEGGLWMGKCPTEIFMITFLILDIEISFGESYFPLNEVFLRKYKMEELKSKFRRPLF